MKKNIRTHSFILAAGVFCILCAGSNCFSEEKGPGKFVYDARGRRDPFVPLYDKDSATGLRKAFTPPEREIRLPIAIEIRGILWNGSEYFAIINDKVMSKGKNIGEVWIREIEKDRVILEYKEKELIEPFKKETKK